MTAETPFDIRREPLDSPVAQELITRLNTELTGQYPEPGATHFRLDPEEVDPNRGVFLVVRHGNRPVGCGAVRRIDPVTGELKRMFVDPTLRGQGLGKHLLHALEDAARELGCRRMVLETGTRQEAALFLYERAGYERIAAFGEYVGSPLSVCMGKDLDPR